jgi:hypothetical protein
MLLDRVYVSATPDDNNEGVDAGNRQPPRSKPKNANINASIVGKPNLPAIYPKRTRNSRNEARKMVRPPGFEHGFVLYWCRPEAVRPMLASGGLVWLLS